MKTTSQNKTQCRSPRPQACSAGPPNNFARRAYALIKARNLLSLLELGCGSGRDAVYFAKKGLAVTAVDCSAPGIENLKSPNPEINCVMEDIRKIKFPKNSFDAIYAHLSLHYFDDSTTSRVFENLFKILKKNGLIFVKCKSVDDALFGQGEKVGENMYKNGHVRHFFSKAYMAEKLKPFKLLKARRTSSVYSEYKSCFIEAVATK